ncbi:hypothetical protein ACN4EK_10185 [Pantanalinema rosaneae CENA516]|uniref:hypothetical protein n=1 Tax=Pantanalinema rosaneae TaxID=1620701 RepID=UPI003D6DD625
MPNSGDDDNLELKSDVVLKQLSKYLEPATIVTLLLSSIYYIGWIYNGAFFKELGIDINWLEFSPDFYLRQFFLPTAITIPSFYLLFQIGKEPGTYRMKAFQGNLLLVALGLVCIFLGYQDDSIFRLRYMLIGISVLLSTIVFSWQRVSIIHLARSKPLFRLLVLFLMFGILVTGASILGRNNGRLIAQGKIIDPVHVTFVWHGKPPVELQDKTLLFLLQNKDKSYVLAKQDLGERSQFLSPKVYVIQDNQVRLRIMERMK